MTGHPVATICRTLRLARQTTYYTPTVRRRGHLKLFDFDIGAHPLLPVFPIRTKGGQSPGFVLGKCPSYHEHPVVVPQVMHLRQVPLRTMVNWPQSPHGSPS